jgi:hypothetical protein
MAMVGHFMMMIKHTLQFMECTFFVLDSIVLGIATIYKKTPKILVRKKDEAHKFFLKCKTMMIMKLATCKIKRPRK